MPRGRPPTRLHGLESSFNSLRECLYTLALHSLTSPHRHYASTLPLSMTSHISIQDRSCQPPWQCLRGSPSAGWSCHSKSSLSPPTVTRSEDKDVPVLASRVTLRRNPSSSLSLTSSQASSPSRSSFSHSHATCAYPSWPQRASLSSTSSTYSASTVSSVYPDAPSPSSRISLDELENWVSWEDVQLEERRRVVRFEEPPNHITAFGSQSIPGGNIPEVRQADRSHRRFMYGPQAEKKRRSSSSKRTAKGKSLAIVAE